MVLVSGDQEYRSEETLPQLAKILAQHHGFDCRVLFTQDPDHPGIINPEHAQHIPGLEALQTADLLILGIRFLNLPDDQMKQIDNYLRSGRPVLGLRTSNHGFRIPKDSKWAHYDKFWEEHGEQAYSEYCENINNLKVEDSENSGTLKIDKGNTEDSQSE